MFFTLCLFFASGSDAYKVTVNPLDFQVEAERETHVSGIVQLESNGDHLFVLCKDEPAVIEIDRDGNFIRKFGKKGDGPGELGFHQGFAMAVNGPGVWFLRNDLTFLNYFEHGDHRAGFRPKSYQFKLSSSVAKRFAFDNKHVLLQAHPSTGRLAYVYDYGGNLIKKVGKTFRVDKAFLAVNPALFTTLWDKDDDHWYCLFAYRPILHKYNKNFEKVAEIFIEGPEVHAFEKRFAENEKDPNFTYPKPHFRDFAVFGDHVYLISDGTFYQIDKQTGETLSRTIFFGNPSFIDPEIHGKKLWFKDFAFLNDGTLFLSNSLHFGHDLWVAKLPYLKKLKPETE